MGYCVYPYNAVKAQNTVVVNIRAGQELLAANNRRPNN